MTNEEKEVKEETLGQFAIEKSTGKIINKPFGDPVAEEYLNDDYDILELSFEDWQNNLKSYLWGYAPYLVNDTIEWRELPECAEQLKKYRLMDESSTLKRYLADTDYVVAKINEAAIEDEAEAQALKEHYADVLIERKRARQRLGEIELLLGGD